MICIWSTADATTATPSSVASLKSFLVPAYPNHPGKKLVIHSDFKMERHDKLVKMAMSSKQF